MNYQETINYLYNQLPVYQNIGGTAYKEGLDNSLALDVYFGHPHRKYKTIHVGGTNGKGSTSHLLAAILQQAGYKVGLYTSPHLLDFRERIRVNGQKISEDYVVNFVEQHKQSYEAISPSFFELTMMMSFCYFADQGVDIAIVEVGLGGRLDSTNIISPITSVITNISLDHTQYLGDTVEKIAKEKAGIIKPQTPIIIGEATSNIREVFENKAKQEKAPIVFAQDLNLINSSERDQSGTWIFQTAKYPNLKCELQGIPQIYNAATVLATTEVLIGLGIQISPDAIYSGFAKVTELTGLMGRWQILKDSNPRIICDTGHNVGGIKYVSEQLVSEQYEQLHIVIGMVNDKDIDSVLSLFPESATYYFTKASIARAMNEHELSEKAKAFGLKGHTYLTVEDAFTEARNKAGKEDLIFIGGSNFIVSEALELI